MRPPGEGSTLAERLVWVREKVVRKGVREFSRALKGYEGMDKLTHTRVLKYEEGRVPSGDYLQAVVRLSGVDADWLLVGRGAPTKLPATDSQRAFDDIAGIVDRYRATVPDEGAERMKPGEASASLPPPEKGSPEQEVRRAGGDA